MDNVLKEKDAVKEQCIDLINDMLKRFSVILVHNPTILDQGKLTNNLSDNLKSLNAALRKKSSSCLGSMAVVMKPKKLSEVISMLMKNINKDNGESSYPYIEALGAITETVGYMLAPNISTIINELKPFVQSKDPLGNTPVEIDHSIKEICLTIFDFSLRKCPKEANAYIDEILKYSLDYLGYDPNFNPDVEMEENPEEDMEGWGDPDEIQNVVEDDSSWKVRKAAAKLLITITKYRSDNLKMMQDKIIQLLTARMSERDEGVMGRRIRCECCLFKGGERR